MSQRPLIQLIPFLYRLNMLKSVLCHNLSLFSPHPSPPCLSLAVPVDPALTELFRSVKLKNCTALVHKYTHTHKHKGKDSRKIADRELQTHTYTHKYRKLAVVWGRL